MLRVWECILLHSFLHLFMKDMKKRIFWELLALGVLISVICDVAMWEMLDSDDVIVLDAVLTPFPYITYYLLTPTR